MDNTLRTGELYRHYKGNIYQIVAGLATHTETNEEVVVYQALYGDYKVYVRPLSMFFETVCDENGNKVPRFAKFGTDNVTPLAVNNVVLQESENKVADRTVGEMSNSTDEEVCEGVNPMLIKFLDADSIEEKLEILNDMRKTIDDKTISDIGVSMDLVIEEGPLEDRLSHLEYYLKTRARFEASRLR
ncbi:MAG: DUF1653 domain-containing protein [Lachnospiraceae bacterium]|nr:DUF1653 domain-containing protein [Lachnospiraceae bacterium]